VQTQIAALAPGLAQAIHWSVPIGKSGFYGGVPARKHASASDSPYVLSIGTNGRQFKAKSARFGGKIPRKIGLER